MVNIYKQWFIGCQHFFQIFILCKINILKEKWFFITVWQIFGRAVIPVQSRFGMSFLRGILPVLQLLQG